MTNTKTDTQKLIEKNLEIRLKIKYHDRIYKFHCLAKHHIPDNYGQDCKKYIKRNK